MYKYQKPTLRKRIRTGLVYCAIAGIFSMFYPGRAEAEIVWLVMILAFILGFWLTKWE